MPEPMHIVVRDRRKKRQYSIDNLIQDQWRPILTNVGYDLYSLYVKLSNKADERAFPGYELIQGHMGYSPSTIRNYNCLLVWCELIHIESGNQFTSNDYYILEVNEVTPERIAAIRAAALAWNKDKKFVTALSHRLDTWHPLQHWFKKSRRHKPVVIHPSQMPLDLENGSQEPGQDASASNTTSLSEVGASPSEVTTSPTEDDASLSEVGASLGEEEQSESHNPNSTIRKPQSNSNNNKTRAKQVNAPRAIDAAVAAAGIKNQEKIHVERVLTRAGFRVPAPLELLREGVNLMTALQWAYWVHSEEADEFERPHGYAKSTLMQKPNASPDGMNEVYELIRDDPDRFKCADSCAFCRDDGEFDQTIRTLLPTRVEKPRTVISGKLAYLIQR